MELADPREKNKRQSTNRHFALLIRIVSLSFIAGFGYDFPSKASQEITMKTA